MSEEESDWPRPAAPKRSQSRRGDPLEGWIPDLIAAQAAMRPDAVAVAAEDQTLTYRELDARADRVARRLIALGVGPDVAVGLCLERSAAMVVGALGILKAGGAYVPLDPGHPPDRLAFMLHDVRAPALVTRPAAAERLPSGPWRLITPDAAEPLMPAEDAPLPTRPTLAGHLAYAIFTSGSTGHPKGVGIANDSLLNLIAWHQRAFAVTDADRASQLANPAFDAAVWELWPYLTLGASVHLPDERARTTPTLLRDWIIERGITISFAPTPLAESLLTLDWPPRTTLRLLLTGGDRLHRHPPITLPFAVVNNYGPTECTVVATSGRVPHTERPSEPPPIGYPIDATEVYIIDADVIDADVRPAPVGLPGELCIGGVGLARGYLNRPELTAEKFIPNPFGDAPGSRLYRTGDIARALPDGQIAFIGRRDRQVKIRGYRIELDEISTVLSQHPDVHACLVAAREEPPGDPRLVAYVVPAAGGRFVVRDLRDYLATQLPDYMVPSAFVRLEALPLTPNGKIDRAALLAPDRLSATLNGDVATARTPIEQRLTESVATLLGLEYVGLDSNFFLLGGHSLLGAQLIARIHDAFGIELSLRTLFEAPTIAALAMEVERLIRAKIEAMTDQEAQQLLENETVHSP
jgi:amino acid adenylation domain-containing protein